MLVPPRDNQTLQPTSGSSTTTMYGTGLCVLSQSRALWLGEGRGGCLQDLCTHRWGSSAQTHLLEPWGQGPGPAQKLPSVLGLALPPAWVAASEEEHR